MNIALIMPPASDFSASFCFLQKSLEAAFSKHELSAWLLDACVNKAKPLPWAGSPEKLFSLNKKEAILFPEQALSWLENMYELEKPDLIIIYGNIFGLNLAGMLAHHLGCGCFSDVNNFDFNEKVYAYKNVCSSNAIWKKEIGSRPFIIAVTNKKSAPTKKMKATYPIIKDSEIKEADKIYYSKFLEKDEENPLEVAETVFIGGRGLGSIETADKLRILAKKMGAEVGFSRPAAMNGWGSMNKVIGQSGLRISPKLCLTFGVSGSAAFLSGISDSEQIVAINTDPNAPIFKAADKGIIADAEETIDHFLNLYSKNKTKPYI